MGLKPPIPSNERERLAELHSLGILDTEKEEAFDRITSLAASLFDVPMALVTLIDEYRQWIKSNHGGEQYSTPRDVAFCSYTILDSTPLVVQDSRQDERFKDNPYVTGDPPIVFYAGAPITTANGLNIGSLCVIDHKPRQLSELQQKVLKDLANIVMSEIELRSRRKLSESELGFLTEALEILPDGVVLFDPQFRCRYANKALLNMLQLSNAADINGWTPEDATAYVKTIAKSLTPIDWRDHKGVQVIELQDRDGGSRFVRRSLHHITRLPTRPFMSIWTDITAETEEIAKMNTEAMTDPGTGLPNRRAADMRLGNVLSKGPASVIIFDIDHFKAINDTYGHPAGDEVLRQVGAVLRSLSRDSDLVCRYGGEEFLAVVEAGHDVALKLAERVRTEIESLATIAGNITISAGVATGTDLNVVQQADARLYEAKQSGRNKVVGG